ncbi:thioredoxin family protein [Pedobacter psychroterrae]|uniref:DUF255 domain-containing protein n=1 Tax=Pedobacter psychroterrae TaxID=2530453 RepID=A0A4R0NUM0_9SPHI|nr:thioredoxin domain-containing protein [Pedobacter psychroterrae]TCD03185.1 DUF255 domain-containing protein [Pedobacter psychroterrae]
MIRTKFIIPAFFLLILWSSVLKAQRNEGIQFFKGTYQEALNKAEKENKLIFMDCYTSWCVPCKKLAAEVFPKREIGEFYNTNFINIQMDMEKGIGIELTKKFGVSAYPTLLLINSSGYKVDQIVGYWEADTLLSWAGRGFSKRKEVTHEMKFDSGVRDAEFISSYFGTLIKEGQIDKARTAFQKILSIEGFKALSHPKYFQLLNLVDFDDPAISYVARHQEQFNKIFTKDSVSQKLRSAFVSVRPLSKIFPFTMPRGYKEQAHQQLLSKIDALYLADREFMVAEIEVYVLSKTGRSEQAFQIAEKAVLNAKETWRYFEMACMVNWCFLNQEYRMKAASWLDTAISLSTDQVFIAEARAFADSLRRPISDSLIIPTVTVMGRRLYGL